MKIRSISNVNFKSVYAVSGSKKQLEDLCDNLGAKTSDKLLTISATDIYKNSDGDGFCARAVKKGKEVSFFVTGENIYDVLFMSHGWGTTNGISKHIDVAYEIKDIQKATDYFKNNIQKDWNDFCEKNEE